MVDATWPGIARTWEWTSRGRGRVDRLALWLGGVADPNAARRFVRVPPSMAEAPVVLRSTAATGDLEERHHPPKRNEYVSILDAALLESGLMADWLAVVAPDDAGRWATLEGRRPQLHHDEPLRLKSSDKRRGNAVKLIKPKTRPAPGLTSDSLPSAKLTFTSPLRTAIKSRRGLPGHWRSIEISIASPMIPGS